MPSYKCKIRSKALDAICAKESLHIFFLTVNPPLGAVLAGSPVIRVLPGSFMCVNNVCPAENQLAASSCMEWRPSCKQTRIEGLFYVKCAEGHRGDGSWSLAEPYLEHTVNTGNSPPHQLWRCGLAPGHCREPSLCFCPRFGLREFSSWDIPLPLLNEARTSNPKGFMDGKLVQV